MRLPVKTKPLTEFFKKLDQAMRVGACWDDNWRQYIIKTSDLTIHLYVSYVLDFEQDLEGFGFRKI